MPRAFLGDHVPRNWTSTGTYGRDNLAHPLWLLEGVRDKVITGEFDPDAKRGGRWVSASSDRSPIREKVEKNLGMSVEDFIEKLEGFKSVEHQMGGRARRGR